MAVLFLMMPRTSDAATLPGTPEVTGTAAGRTVTLSWPGVSQAEGYLIQIYRGSSKSYKNLTTVTETASQYKKSFVGGVNQTYKYRVYSYRTENSKKIYSRAAGVTVKTMPSPATSITSARKDSSGRGIIKWKTNTYAEGYVIYRSENANSYTRIATISGKSVGTYTDKSVKSGKSYSYRVRAYRKNTGSVIYGSYANTVKLSEYQTSGSYKRVFVGDSRTLFLQNYYSSAANTKWICKSGAGYSWLANTADSQITENIGQNTALIIWMGVNDPDNISKYLTYYNKMIPKWKAAGATVYIAAATQVQNDPYVTNAEITIFDRKLYAGLSSAAVYLPLNVYLSSAGYQTIDGTHYDQATCAKIYNYFLNHT